LLRKRSWEWAREMATSLTNSPLALPCWRWNDPEWPPFWENMRRHPLRIGVGGGLRQMLANFVRCIRLGRWPHPAYWFFPNHIQFGLVIAWEKWHRHYAARRRKS